MKLVQPHAIHTVVHALSHIHLVATTNVDIYLDTTQQSLILG